MFAGNSVNAEQINSFDSQIAINKDGTINVKETITYDFGYLQKHGIYREIPYVKTNKDGKKFELKFSNFSVTDENDNDFSFVTAYINEQIIRLKIGDANRLISGIHTYVISYQVSGALTYFSDHDELYWNVTGNEWKVPIDVSTAAVGLPPGIKKEDIKTSCYTGYSGSLGNFCSSFINNQTAVFNTTVPLGSYQGMTVVISFPKNIVAVLEPKEFVSFWDTPIGKLVGLVIGLLALLWYVGLPFFIVYKWFKSGRDPKSTVGVTTAWFDPPKTQDGKRFLTPGEVGTLGDETVDMKDISATIIDLARRGYLIIDERKKGDFYLVRKKEFYNDPELLDFEKILLAAIFTDTKNLLDNLGDVLSKFSATGGISVSYSFPAKKTTDVNNPDRFQEALKNLQKKGIDDEVRLKNLDLAQGIEAVKSSLYEDVVKEGMFAKNPQSIRTGYYVLAGVAVFTGNIFLALVAFFFGRAMPSKTVFGVEAKNVAFSLKNFLSSQKRQLEFQADKQMMFERLLPFAIAFGVERIWAKRFADINLSQPSWYHGYTPVAVFNSNNFVSNVNSSMKSFQTAATPTSSSSGFSSGMGGGGFSGGGGGGGGGGSW